LLSGIEKARLWAYFHKDWLLQMRSLLRLQLPEEYRLFVESEAILISPDATASVLPDASTARPEKATASTSKVSVSRATAAVIEVEEPRETVNRYRLLIRRAPENLVVAALEILSPSNKGLGSSIDQEKHLRKRSALLDAGVNVLEIDALLEGNRILPASLSSLAEFDRNAWTAFHSDGQRKLRGWGWNEPDPLPIISWKVDDELEVLVDLPLALEQAREFNRWDSLVPSS
ncbi:MAG TPA: DUF4058 family protein, partial [Vicinamibacteria bacterium]|nr:DUF4058 family protein [Vicinamibacteria bacterium]